MGIMRRVAEFVRLATFGADETPPRPIAEVLLEMSHAGLLPRAGRAEALSVTAVLRARNLICSPATLPLVQKNAALQTVRLPLLEQIDRNVANVVTLAQTLEDLLFDGISWWRILEQGADEYPTFAQHVDLANVSLQPPGAPSPSPLPGGHDPRNAVVYMYGEPVPAPRTCRPRHSAGRGRPGAARGTARPGAGARRWPGRRAGRTWGTRPPPAPGCATTRCRQRAGLRGSGRA